MIKNMTPQQQNNMFVISEQQHSLLLKLAQNTTQRQGNKTGRSLRPSVFLNDFESLAENVSLPSLQQNQQDKQLNSPSKALEIGHPDTEQETLKLPRIGRFSRFRKIHQNNENTENEPHFLSHQPSPQRELIDRELPILVSKSPDFKNRSSLAPNTERRRTTKKNVHFQPIAEIMNQQGTISTEIIERPIRQSRFKRTYFKLQTEVN